MTFGDVLAITLLITVTITTLWAGLVAFTVLFSRRAQVAANALKDAPGKQIGIGALIALVAGTISVMLMTAGGPVAMIGFAMLAAALALAVLGSSGIALLIAERLQTLEPGQSRLRGATVGAALAVATGLLPVIGWFFLMPALLFASLGAGLAALRTKATAPAPERQAVPLVAEN
ncbi:MAG: hypothetical protein H7Y38_17500 [Armatimonadetes bacterium]|nr:hypothetical protein [Armatimonadota bacterium]